MDRYCLDVTKITFMFFDRREMFFDILSLFMLHILSMDLCVKVLGVDIKQFSADPLDSVKSDLILDAKYG